MLCKQTWISLTNKVHRSRVDQGGTEVTSYVSPGSRVMSTIAIPPRLSHHYTAFSVTTIWFTPGLPEAPSDFCPVRVPHPGTICCCVSHSQQKRACAKIVQEIVFVFILWLRQISAVVLTHLLEVVMYQRICAKHQVLFA